MIDTYRARGYPFADRGAYDLNLFGVRNNRRPGANAFDDVLGCAFREQPLGPVVVRVWRGTTDPGLTYTAKPGYRVAVVRPGHYPGLWELGQHPRKGGPTAHRAFVQRANIAVYRDVDMDGEVDDAADLKIELGLFGINGHRAGRASTRVDGWSAGCQVWARQDDHSAALRLADEQVRRGLGATFSYALFTLAEHPELSPLFAQAGVVL